MSFCSRVEKDTTGFGSESLSKLVEAEITKNNEIDFEIRLQKLYPGNDYIIRDEMEKLMKKWLLTKGLK